MLELVRKSVDMSNLLRDNHIKELQTKSNHKLINAKTTR